MSSLSGIPLSYNNDVFTSNANQQATLGSLGFTPDGRKFRYIKAGATTLVPGKLQQGPAEDTTLENLTPTATAIGATTVVTSSTLTVTANQLAGGFLVVTVTPGQGYTYRINGNQAATSAAVTLTLEDPIQVALTSSSRIDLIPSPYNGVIVNPTTQTGTVVGVAVFPVVNAQFGWVQTGGPVNVLAQGTLTVGNAAIASTTTAGAVVNGATDGSTSEQAPVGVNVTGVATTEYGLVNLNLD